MRRTLTIGILSLLLAAGWAGAQEPSDGWFAASDGVKLHYLILGEGPPVILIHGYTANARDKWFGTGVAQELARRHHRVVALDCRGHGESDKPHDPKAYGPRMAEDVIELMDELAIDRAH